MTTTGERRVRTDDVFLVVGSFAFVSLCVLALNVEACDDPTRDLGRSQLGPLCRPTGTEGGPGATLGEVVAMAAVDSAGVIVSGVLMTVARVRDSRRWLWLAVGAGILSVLGSLFALGHWATVPPVISP
jgi:hypothetical protein